MQCYTRKRPSCGFTLLELLCVFALITLLASLLLGPVSRVLQRVLADKWSEDATALLQSTVAHLNQFFQGQQNFPLVTVESIQAAGLLKAEELRFLKDRRVIFTPFSGQDPAEKIVIQVEVKHGFFTENTPLFERKEAITRIPN